ncbi:hypothetical protein [Acidisoma sp. 7E03]
MSVLNSIAVAVAPWLGVGALVGAAVAGKSVASWAAAMSAKTKDDVAFAALSRVTAGMGRLAGEIAMDVAPLLGTGADAKTVLAAGVADGVKKVQERFPNDVALLGAGEDLLGSMLKGEVGKVLAPAMVSAAPATATSSGTVSTETLLTHAITTLGKVATGGLTAASVAGAATAAAAAAAPVAGDAAVTGAISELKSGVDTVANLVSGAAAGAAAKATVETQTSEQVAPAAVQQPAI